MGHRDIFSSRFPHGREVVSSGLLQDSSRDGVLKISTTMIKFSFGSWVVIESLRLNVKFYTLLHSGFWYKSRTYFFCMISILCKGKLNQILKWSRDADQAMQLFDNETNTHIFNTWKCHEISPAGFPQKFQKKVPWFFHDFSRPKSKFSDKKYQYLFLQAMHQFVESITDRHRRTLTHRHTHDLIQG